MKINSEQYEKIKHALPVQRGNITVENIVFINALLYICENGCKWRRLPKEYGSWNAVYKRFRRWVENGIIERLFIELLDQKLVDDELVKRLMDSMIAPVHPDACGALKKTVSKQLDVPKAD
jgi:transposase